MYSIQFCWLIKFLDLRAENPKKAERIFGWDLGCQIFFLHFTTNSDDNKFSHFPHFLPCANWFISAPIRALFHSQTKKFITSNVIIFKVISKSSSRFGDSRQHSTDNSLLWPLTVFKTSLTILTFLIFSVRRTEIWYFLDL